jgi:hypothetical protein
MDTGKQTYTSAHRKYYELNKDIIRERRKDTSRQYSKDYYAKHKEQINARRKEKREKAKQVITDEKLPNQDSA